MNGRRIHNYEIVSHLGEGGMGTVYKASDTVLGRPVALKMLHATLLQQSQFLERFKKEARLLAQLLHPNIAVIYNLIEQDGQQYMVMEYVEGRNLETLLQKDGTVPYEVVVPVFLQALDGLHHAHRKGIFHRDIKPSNLILTPDGTVKLMDFGIAMMAGDQRLTQVNRMVGTLGYMAPELIEAKAPSVASDLYAAGITMYELLTGKLPFADATDYHLMQNILKQKPVAPDRLNPSLPKALSAILLKSMEKNPASRFADAQEMKAALAKAFPALVHADISETSPLLQRAAPRATVITSRPTSVQSLTPPETRIAQRPTAMLEGWKERLPTGRKRVLALGLLLLLFIVAGLVLWSGSDPAPAPPLVAQTTGDTVKKRSPVVEEGSSVQEQSQPAPQPVPVLTVGGNEGNGDGEEKKEEKREVTPEEKKNTHKGQPAPIEKKTVVEPVKPDPVPVVETPKVEEVKRPARTIRLAHSPDITLYLTSSFDAATAKTRQVLSFRVTRDVRYDGAVIIEQGATATGYIKSVGSKKISIVVSAVTGVNGQSLPVQEEEVSGRIDDMVSNRDYIVNLRKGIEIHL